MEFIQIFVSISVLVRIKLYTVFIYSLSHFLKFSTFQSVPRSVFDKCACGKSSEKVDVSTAGKDDLFTPGIANQCIWRLRQLKCLFQLKFN